MSFFKSMDYKTPRDAYHAYKNDQMVPNCFRSYTIDKDAQVEYQSYMSRYAKEREAEGVCAFEIMMDFLRESIEQPFIYNQILEYIAISGKRTKISIMQANNDIKIRPNFYIICMILMTLWDLQIRYDEHRSDFKRKIRTGPFAHYQLDISSKHCSGERMLNITLNKPSFFS